MKKSITDDRAKLRKEAEARLVRDPPPDVPQRPTPELLHEFQVHQIELEMQNEELRRNQLELEEAHARQIDLYDFAPVGYLTLDDKGIITGANLTAASLLGKDRANLVGRRFPGLVAESDSIRWHRFFSTLVTRDDRAACRLALARGDETTFEAHLACERRRGDGGPQVRVVLTDVTEFAQLEAALSASEASFRELFHAVPALLWTISPDGAVTDCNRAWCEFTGMTREQSLGSGWMDALHPDDQATTLAAAADAMARGSLYQVEQRLRRHDGEYRWFLTRGTPIRDSTGAVLRWHGANVDISERKMAEDALKDSEDRQRSIVTAMVEGVVLQDANGKVVQCNRAAERILGLSQDQMEGRTSMDPRWRSVHEDGSPFPGEDHPAMMSLRTGAAVTGVIMGVHRPDGTLTWISINAEPLRHSETDPPHAVVATFADITKPRALQAQMALASRLAAMGTLVTGVAHEINNPLAAEMADQGMALELVGEVRARLDGSDPLDRKFEAKLLGNVVEALEDAQGSGQRIARIVKDLTTFGRPGSKRERVQMIDIVNGALRWLPNTVGRTVTIQVENGGAPDVVAASGQIEQVLVNLLTNAARATPEGKRDTVIVRIGPGDSGMARLEVIDHGTGMGPGILGRVFEPFFTTHRAGVGSGMGLGLAISYAIVTAHGGTITATSEVGRGSRFIVELPAAPAEA